MTLRLALLALLACGPTRRGILAVTPTVPRSEGVACPAVPWRCDGGVPMRCAARDGEARWWPMHAIGDDGRPAPCASRCVLDTVAHCAPAEVQP